MAYYFLFPEKVSTIYSHPDRLKLNTGHDEILEIVKEKGTSDSRYYPSRALIKFNNTEIQTALSLLESFRANSFSEANITNNLTQVSLQLLSTEHKNLSTILNLEAYPISQSWDEGSGRYSNLPTSSNGVTCKYRDNDIAKTQWPTGSQALGATFATSSIAINEIPSGSLHELTINGVDFVPVVSASLFDDNDKEVFVEISGSLQAFTENLVEAINASSSLTLVTASISGAGPPALILSGSSSGSLHNVTITTSSIGSTESPSSTGFTYVNPIFVPSTGSIPVEAGSGNSFNLTSGTDIAGSDFMAGTSGSLIALGITVGGGSWYTGSNFEATQQFLQGDNLDTNLDVTTSVKKFSASYAGDDNSVYPTGIDNNGFIIKQPDTVETNTSNSFGEMKYFSADTHTIYPPRLVFKWDDSTHTYQSSAKTSGELSVSLYKNQKEYNQNDVAMFRVHIRDKYPNRAFTTTSNYLSTGYFTTGSYYSIRDANTEEEVIPFDDNYTKMSADSDGMYFKVYMQGLQPERYYRVLFKHINNDGTVIYDNDYHFKVIR